MSNISTKMKVCHGVLTRVPTHPAGRALASDWFVNNFVMVVYVKFFKEFSHFLSKSRLQLNKWALFLQGLHTQSTVRLYWLHDHFHYLSSLFLPYRNKILKHSLVHLSNELTNIWSRSYRWVLCRILRMEVHFETLNEIVSKAMEPLTWLKFNIQSWNTHC